jgi:hypothetical protein
VGAEKALVEDTQAPTAVVEPTVERTEAAVDRLGVGAAARPALPRSNGVPGAARAASLLSEPRPELGAPSRARMARAMQRSVGRARTGRMLDAVPPAGAALPTPSAFAAPAVSEPDVLALPAAEPSPPTTTVAPLGRAVEAPAPGAAPAAAAAPMAGREAQDEDSSPATAPPSPPGAPAAVDAGTGPAATAAPVAAPAPAAGAESPTGVPAEPGAPAAEGDVVAAATDSAVAAAGGSPRSPQEDPAFAELVMATEGVARAQRRGEPPARKAAEVHAAAQGPSNERQAKAAAAQVETMDRQEPGTFDRAAFVAAVRAKVAEIAPRNLEEIDTLRESGRMEQATGVVAQGVQVGAQAAGGAIGGAARTDPDPSAHEAKETTPLPAAAIGAAPAAGGAGAAAPKPKTDAEVSLAAGSQSLDAQMSDAGVGEAQLERSNEPDFQAALGAKREAQADAAAAPGRYREDEAASLVAARSEAVAVTGRGLGAMHARRGRELERLLGHQSEGKSRDEGARAKVARDIETIYAVTKTAVETRLARIDTDVTAAFDAGADAAVAAALDHVERRFDAYKEERYSGPLGWARWVKDRFADLPAGTNVFYDEGRAIFTRMMDAVIDQVAGIVETGLADAKAKTAEGSRRVAVYVAGLEFSLQEVGRDALEAAQGRFEELAAGVDAKQSELVDSLAQRYVERVGQLDEKLAAIKESNRGLVSKAKDVITGVINAITRLKQLLVSAASAALSIVEQIISDPIGFLANLIAGLKQGLQSFVSRIDVHLQEGLVAWLFGSLASAGVRVPQRFDLRGIMTLILGALGVTYANIRTRAAKLIGEPVVRALEATAGVFSTLASEGPGALWRDLVEQVGNLKDTLLDEIRSWVITRVITAGVTWILSLLNPASAFIRAVKLIIDIVRFFIERGSQIVELVTAIIQSLAAIASGSVGAMAKAVERALARALPVAIGFLASLLGLGGIADAVKKILAKAQTPIWRAIDWIIGKAVQLARKVGGLFGGKKARKEETKADPAKQAKIDAGLAQLDAAEAAALTDGAISHEAAERVAAAVRGKNRVFRSITVVDGGDRWDYRWSASPGGTNKGEGKKAETQKIIRDLALTRRSFSAALKAEFARLYPLAAAKGNPLRLRKLEGKKLARRHRVPFESLLKRVKGSLIGKTWVKAAEILAGESERRLPPAKPFAVKGRLTLTAITHSAQAWLNSLNNDPTNLFPGLQEDDHVVVDPSGKDIIVQSNAALGADPDYAPEMPEVGVTADPRSVRAKTKATFLEDARRYEKALKKVGRKP